MIRYFLGRDLADRLGVPLARWKRWAREFLPPDPLGGLQSGYARHYSIDQAFTVYLAGHLVSRLRFSIPESRQILADLDHWLAAEGYRTAATAESAGESNGVGPAAEHLILIDRLPPGAGPSAKFVYTIRGLLARRQLTRPGGQIEEEHYLTARLPCGEDQREHPPSLEQQGVYITRILRQFAGRLALNAHIFAALRHDPHPR